MLSEKVNTENVNILKLLQERVKFGDITKFTDTELLTIIIGSHLPKGRASSRSLQTEVELIVERCGYDLTTISTMGCSDLMRQASISLKLATVLLAVVEISTRIKNTRESVIDVIHNSKDTFKLLAPKLSGALSEEFWVVYLGGSNRVLECVKISQGGIDHNVVDVRLVIKRALGSLASKMILAHNHPSGSLKPSDMDIELTSKIRKAAALFDIIVLDHVILSKGSYYSFSDCTDGDVYEQGVR